MELLQTLSRQMDEFSKPFFQGEAIPFAQKEQMKHTLSFLIPQGMFDQYRSLTPDFFAWLE
jgi:hypothetical protein